MIEESSLSTVKDSLIRIKTAQTELNRLAEALKDILSIAEDAEKILYRASNLASDVEYNLNDLRDEFENY
jgi:hypothetical protein